MTARNRGRRTVDVALGLGYLLLIGAVVAVTALTYNGAFKRSDDVELRTGPVGNALQKGSDVKLDGVVVGRVTGVSAVGGGASVDLALDPDAADKIPSTTTARLLPKTLFGERYVSLVLPASRGGEMLRSGDTIRQDTSAESVELEQVFDELLPLLRSIQPDKLSATLGELATALRGQGRKIGDTMVSTGEYLEKLEPLIPQITDDAAKLATVANVYADASPDLLNALDTLTTTSRTLVAERGGLADLYGQVITASDQTRDFVEANQDTIVVLADQSRKALEAVAPYATEFPCLFESARRFIPVMDRTLGKGTGEPGMHVRLTVVKSRGKYVPGKDKPRFSSSGKPRCPYVTGQTGTRPAPQAAMASKGGAKSAGKPAQPSRIAAPRTELPEQLQRGAGLGPANSPAENQLISELMASEDGVQPERYPAWGSLLVGPVLRGAEVSLR